MQSKLSSLIEVMFNVAIGFVISFIANIYVLPAFGHGSPSMLNNLGMTAAFTVLSIVRSYILRRYFNSKIKDASVRVAEAYLNKHGEAV